MSKNMMTREGFNKLSEQYKRMKNEELSECLAALTEAREKGDISENAEYEVAKQQLDELNMKISKLGAQLMIVQIIESAVDDRTVQLLTFVKFKNLKNGIETEYKIVPETEISTKEGKISPSSPIGKALMGKKAGDKINVNIPAGKLDLEILSVRCK
jgi:transcription elongation factor GreA